MDIKLGLLLFSGIFLCSTYALPAKRSPCVCTRDLKQVCGSDGKTYNNRCLLNCERQTHKSHLKVVKEGPCDNPPDTCVCTAEYEPVCGSDLQTYPNECTLKCEQKRNGQLQLQYKGECKVPEQPPCSCPRTKKPVCGSDGKTYDNDCLLNCATARDSSLSIRSAGPCKDKVIVGNPDAGSPSVPEEPSCSCPTSGEKVCGSDGKIYKNRCLLNCATDRNPSLNIASFDRCTDTNDMNKPNNPADVSETCICTDIYRPVCGSDGKTYPNDCQLNCATAQDSSLSIRSAGACEDSLSDGPETCICPLVYSPVCGSDGKTYSNDCQLNCATAQDSSLSIRSAGACENSLSDGPETCICPQVYSPVCGSDGKTYGNDCELNCATAQDSSLSIKSAGACENSLSDGPETCVCPAIYSPVCGSDGKSYDNDCLLNCATAADPTLRISSYSACENDNDMNNPDNPMDEPIVCELIDSPVCGSDGITYPNECMLRSACENDSLSIRSYGPCADEEEDHEIDQSYVRSDKSE